MIVKTRSLIRLTKKSTMAIPLARVSLQLNENCLFSSCFFFWVEIVKIEFKMTFQSFV